MSKSMNEWISHRENWFMSVILLIIQFFRCTNDFDSSEAPLSMEELFSSSEKFLDARASFRPCAAGG
jgi:hypothetical protein